jgi:hypothetical protein
MLTFVSKQLWPQFLALAAYAPQRLVLLHSDQKTESAGPAERLREFAIEVHGMRPESVELVEVSSSNVGQLRDEIGEVAERLELDGSNCVFNLTGGIKLMTMAGAGWCQDAGSPCFYIESNNQLFEFVNDGRDLRQSPQRDLAREVAGKAATWDPAAVVRYQLDAADVVDPGQLLTLNEKGKRWHENELGSWLTKRMDFRGFLQMDGSEPEAREGDDLELATAIVLLKLGVPQIRRGIRTTARQRSRDGNDEGEMDLVFIRDGRLWVVDCKDRHSPEERLDALRNELVRTHGISPRTKELLDRLASELQDKELKTLKEDLSTVAEAGGLKAQALIVRRGKLPTQAMDYARGRRMEVVLKDHLVRDLKKVLGG